MSILDSIPAARLALLDQATLYHGSHGRGTGDPDCEHCARELLHEVVTGEHRDATPPGCTALIGILPTLNDGPWASDVQRTETMRPYLKRMLALDPAKDEQRIYALIDHVYRKSLPDICDALKLDTHATALRDLAPIIDRQSLQAAARAGLAARAARAALAARADLAALAARAGLAALADRADLAALAELAARADRAADGDYEKYLAARIAAYAQGVKTVLDLICGIGGDREFAETAASFISALAKRGYKIVKEE